MFFRSGSAEELYDYGGEHFGFYHVRLASQRESPRNGRRFRNSVYSRIVLIFALTTREVSKCASPAGASPR